MLGALSWGVAMVLWMWVLKRLEIGQVSASIYLLSLFGVLLSAITLHERLTLIQIAGGIMVLLARFLLHQNMKLCWPAVRQQPGLRTRR